MSQVDYAAMTNEQLRQYMLEHRHDCFFCLYILLSKILFLCVIILDLLLCFLALLEPPWLQESLIVDCDCLGSK